MKAIIIAITIKAHAEIVFIVLGFVLSHPTIFCAVKPYSINVEKSKITQEIIKIINWITKSPSRFKNCGNIAAKNTQAFGLRKATKKPSLNNERLLFVEKLLLKSKFFEDLNKSKAMYNKYKIPIHLK